MTSLRRRLAVLLVAVAAAALQTGSASATASLRSQIGVVVTSNLTNTVGLAAAAAPVILQRVTTMADGNGAGQARVLWTARRTIAASTTEDLDMIGGGLTDPFGTAFAPAKIRAIIIAASAGNTNNLIIGGDANGVPFLEKSCTGSVCAGFAKATVQPGGVFLMTGPALAGIPVTAGTGDIIQVANSGAGTSVTYDIVVIGTSS